MAIISSDKTALFELQVRVAEDAFNAVVLEAGHYDCLLGYMKIGTNNEAALKTMAARASDAGWNVRLIYAADREVMSVNFSRDALPPFQAESTWADCADFTTKGRP